MPTRQPLVSTDRANQLVGAVKAGVSQPKAAKLMHIPLSTAKYILKKYRETGSVHRRPGSGRAPIITERMQRLVIRNAREFRRMPLHEVGKTVSPIISGASVRRIIAKVGMHRRKARKVIFLTKDQKKARLAWAKKMKKLSAEDWERVIWSDEVYVVLGDRAGAVWVTRAADEEWDEDCCLPKFKQSNLRIMAWACIMRNYKSPIIVLEYPGGKGGGMTAARYQHQVLDKMVVDVYQRACEEKGYVLFEQDGAPSHTAKSTQQFLKDHLIDLFPQPASSPDVVPLESLWHTLKQKIRARKDIPTKLEDLKIAVREAWDSITIEEVNQLVDNMPERVKAVIASRGGHTRF